MQDQDWDRVDPQTDAGEGPAGAGGPDTARLGGDASAGHEEWLSRGTAANTGASTLDVFAGTRQLEDAPPGDTAGEAHQTGGARAAGGGARAAYRNDPRHQAGSEPGPEPDLHGREPDASAG